MRGRITCLIGVVALIAMVSVGWQTAVAETRLLPEVGINLPTGDMADNFSRGGLSAGSGLNVGASVENVMGPYLSLLLDWRYFTFPIQNVGSGNVDLQGHALGITGRAYVEGKHARPFLTFGLMYAKPKLTGNVPALPLIPGSNEATGTASMDWTFGWHAGFGVVDRQSDRFALFVALEYYMLATNGKTAKIDIDSDYIPSMSEFHIYSDGTWFGIHAGIAITLPGVN